MSNKTHCPGCDSYTSSLTEAFESGFLPCPYCGLSNDAWREIVQIQRARDDDKLAQRCTELRVENDKLKRELQQMHDKLDGVKADMRRFVEGVA